MGVEALQIHDFRSMEMYNKRREVPGVMDM
jgi:hypothetical protein